MKIHKTDQATAIVNLQKVIFSPTAVNYNTHPLACSLAHSMPYLIVHAPKLSLIRSFIRLLAVTDAVIAANNFPYIFVSLQLPFVKDQLSQAEVARRRGDTKAVYAAYEQLAELFSELADQRTSVYFWEKCAEISRLTADGEGEAKAMRALGVAHQALGDVTTAISYFEKLNNLAQTSGEKDKERLAATHLYAAYNLMAAEADGNGDLMLALAYREKGLTAANSSEERSMVSKAHFMLGQAHEKLAEMSHLNEAVANYKPYLTLCEQAEDNEGQGAACFALARTYQRLEVRTRQCSACRVHL
eukprot:6209122-Pleurochrysis_carterae.AAC.4